MNERLDIKGKYTRTSSSNLEELSLVFGGEFIKSHIKTLNISVDDTGEWSFYRRNMEEVVTNKFRLGQTFYYVDDFGQNLVGVVTMEPNKFIFEGKVDDDKRADVPTVIIIWEFSKNKIVQITTALRSVGITGVFVKSTEVYESDQEIIYKGEFRTTLRPFIDTKLPDYLVTLPELAPAPAEWCTCEEYEEDGREGDDDDDDDDDIDPSCSVHGVCDECEKRNEFCDCDWFYEEHYCLSCGVTLWLCDCNHILEILDKEYEF